MIFVRTPIRMIPDPWRADVPVLWKDLHTDFGGALVETRDSFHRLHRMLWEHVGWWREGEQHYHHDYYWSRSDAGELWLLSNAPGDALVTPDPAHIPVGACLDLLQLKWGHLPF